ncbi:MAG: anthranilate synthase component I family protein [Desulfobacula sp.]|nr:anthranilate synthase component I family protein [Desulfobacula sp.]
MMLKKFPDKKAFKKMAQKYNVIPVCARILADTHTPVSILKKLYSKNRPIFLLESVEGGEKWARYSFLGICAKSRIRVLKDNVEICSDTNMEKIPHNGDQLKILKKLTDEYMPATMKELPGFWCGMTGYISYEMVSFFEDVQTFLPEDKAYAHFIIPDEIIIFDNMKHTMTCIGIAYIDDKSQWQEAYEKASKKAEKIIQKTFVNTCDTYKQSSGKAHEITLIPEMKLDTFKNKVEKIKTHIIDGDIIQAVLSQKFSSNTAVDPVKFYRAQRYINPSPYMFFMHFEDMTIAGSSPETMVRLENSTATLRPIAGTRQRGETQARDMALVNELLNDEKEKAEHLMLVDLGRNDLGRIAKTGSVQVTDLMFVEKYSHVMHLVSNITCDVKKEMDAWDLLRASFPAGTLSGAPKIRAMEIISKLEDNSREIYGGAAGYISFSGNMDMAITIRTAVMENDSLTIRAGAGIVYDSDPDQEYQECINKAKSVEAALKLAMSSD